MSRSASPNELGQFVPKLLAEHRSGTLHRSQALNGVRTYFGEITSLSTAYK